MSTHLERHVRRFEDDPADSGAFEALEERYFREGAWSDLVPLYERRLEGCGEALEPPERARLLFRLGQALDEGLDRPEAAAERVRQAIELDPNFAPAIRLLRRQASALGDWSTALAMIERELALTERDDEMVRLQAELGEVALGCAGDPERALRAFNTALTAEPEQPMALAGRARALEALERPQDAAVAWEEALARLEGETRDHAVRDFGRLLEGELGDRDRALDLYEAAHEAAPLEPEWQEAIARVQGLRAAAADGPAVADAPTPAAADREPGTPPGPTARAVAEAPQRRGGLSDVRREVARLEQAAGLAETDSAERARLLVQIGEAQEHRLRDLESACDAYQLAFTLAPELPGLALALDRVLRALGLLEELAPVLERAGQAEGAPESERVQVFCSLGALRLDHQDDPLRAADAFEAALALDPGHATALEGLVRAARASGDPDALLRACEREAVTCAAERLPELVAQIVSLCGAREDLERALPAAGRWAQERPQERAALETLAHVLGEAGHTEELAGCLERLDALLDGPERAANRRRLGYLHAAEGRTEGAIDAWRAALEAEPSDEASLEALVDALSEAERYDELIRLFDQRPTTRARESRAVALARARALEATGHREEALALYRELRSVYLGVPEVEQAFERLARALGDADALAEALGERVRTERDADARARLQLERAELLDTDLGRGEEARALYGAVLDANPEAELAERAVARLEALLERLGAFDELVDRLGARAREGSDAELEARIAELAAARLGDASRALEHLERALALQPERGDWWRRLGALLGDDGDPAQQLRAIEGELAAGPEAERAHALHQRAGRLAAGPLADPERASAHYEPVLEVEPGHAEACEFLIALHGDAGRFAELEPLLRARLAALDGPEEVERRTGLRLRLAALLVDELDRPEEAVAALEAGRRDAGPTPAIAGALADLYERLRHWTPLGALCEEAAERAARPEERAVWLVRLGHAERASGRGAEAIAAYRRALEARPAAPGARDPLRELLRERREAEPLTELLEEDLGAGRGDETDLRAELADLYEGPLEAPERALEHVVALVAGAPTEATLRERAIRLAGAAERPELAADLLRRAAGDPLVRGRAALWRRCAELERDALGRPERAVEAFRESLRLDGRRPEVRRALRPLLEELGCHAEALEVLHAEVADADPEARQPLLEYGAELAATHLDDDALRPWLERLVAERPDDPELWLRLAALHERGRRPAARERALRATCAVLARTDAEPERLRDLQLERARILERELGAPARAIAALEAARASDPEHETALVELDRLYTEQGRPRQLAELLDTRIARARDAARFELERRAAQVRADELGEMERAAEIWLGLLRAGAIASEERAASLPRIARVLRAAGRLEAWAELAEEELEASTGESALSLRRELAATWMAPLARPERALPHLRALVDAGKARDAESLALLDALRAAGDAVELARRLEQRLQQHPDDPGGWTELARLREERLWAPGAAARAWSHVLELDPTARAAMAGLRRASERLGDWAEVAHWLEREIAVGLPGPALAWRRVARLHWERLGDAANAERAFGAAHDIDPTDPEALRGLQKIALARRQWSRAIELFEDELELLAGPGTEAARAALWLRIAELATGPAQEPARADRAFVEADATGELGAAELAAWADVRALGGRDAAWCEVFERWCAHADAEPLARDWLALAECHEAQDRAEGARRCLERGLELDPQDGAGWQLAARLAERAGDRSAAADAWARAADLAPGPAAARALTRAAAHLEGRDPLAAADLLERAVARDRTATAANAALARVAARVDRVERATAAAGRLLELAEAAHDVPAHEALAAFLAGARSARALARWEDVADLSAAALEVEALCAEALALSGEASHRLEDWKRCRAHLEALLSLPECDDERTRHAARLGRALEALGREQDALARFEQALTDGPDLEDAHAGRARVLEALGRREEAAGAWAAWAERSGDPRRRAERLARAARLELEAGLSERAERWLRGALDADPDCAEAAVALATALWQADRRDEAFEVATTSADRLSDDGAVAALESVRGRTFEARGESPSALAAYRRAAQSDPDALEAGLAAARLLRASGAWRAAESWLVELSERHARPEGRAELLLATGRLRAGPLEDMSGAIDAYRSALELAPGREDVREVLAALLEHVPAHAGEARDEHRRLLAGEPTRTRSIRSLVRLARESSSARDARAGLAILRALGAASAEEREQAPARLEFSVSGSTGADPVRASLEDALGAGASLWAEIAAHNEVLSAPRAGRESTHKAGGHPIAAQRRAYLQAEAERAGPGLLALAPQDFEAAVRALLQAGGLVLPGQAPGGAEPLRLELGARQRRKLRRTLRELDPAAIDGLDFASWQQELRATVMARALDAAGGDLRAALLVLLEESGEAEVEALPPEADLTRWVAATPSARLLLGQVLSAWTG